MAFVMIAIVAVSDGFEIQTFCELQYIEPEVGGDGVR
jgi:hypothetical protein